MRVWLPHMEKPRARWEYFIRRQRHGRGYGIYTRRGPDQRKTDQWQLAYVSRGMDPPRYVTEQEAFDMFCAAINKMPKRKNSNTMPL